MIIKELQGDLVFRYSDDPTKRLHKIGTEEYYKSAYDLNTSTYEYEEVEDPDYREEEDSDDPEDLS